MKKHFITIPVLVLALFLSIWGCGKDEEAESVTVPETIVEETVTEEPVAETPVEEEPVIEEPVDESYKRLKTSKGTARKVIDNLTLAESLIRKNKDLADIAKAIKDIKSELIVRGF